MITIDEQETLLAEALAALDEDLDAGEAQALRIYEEQLIKTGFLPVHTPPEEIQRGSEESGNLMPQEESVSVPNSGRLLPAELDEPSMSSFVVRSIEDALSLYRSTLTDIVERVASSGNVRNGVETMKSLIIGMADQAYAEGMRKGGIADAEENMDATDLSAINQWVAGQTPFVSNFLSTVAEEGQTDKILGRIEMWVNALAALAHQALAAAKANMMVTWNYGQTEEHCDTCAGLAGVRHRMSWFVGRGLIPREPGSETLECNGYRCDCRLVDDNGQQVI